jgi:hypothetical protein
MPGTVVTRAEAEVVISWSDRHDSSWPLVCDLAVTLAGSLDGCICVRRMSHVVRWARHNMPGR